MEHYRTKNTGRGGRRPRSAGEARARLERQWDKAVQYAALQRPLPAEKTPEDLTELTAKFNQFDQDAIISGAGLALGTAICLIPAVGVVACAVVGTIITAGVLYLSYNGKCPNNKQLKVYLPNRVAGCVA